MAERTLSSTESLNRSGSSVVGWSLSGMVRELSALPLVVGLALPVPAAGWSFAVSPAGDCASDAAGVLLEHATQLRASSATSRSAIRD